MNVCLPAYIIKGLGRLNAIFNHISVIVPVRFVDLSLNCHTLGLNEILSLLYYCVKVMTEIHFV